MKISTFKCNKVVLILLSTIGFASTVANAACSNANRYGDPNWVYDSTKNDTTFPDMQEWREAGVENGVPCKESLTKVKTKWVTNTGINAFQNKINSAAVPNGQKSAYVLVKNGTHYLDKPLNMKSGIVLRGESKQNTIIIVRIKHEWNQNGSRKIYAVNFDDVENSGIENLTIKYQVKDQSRTYMPLDRNNYNQPTESIAGAAWPFANEVKVKRNNPNKTAPYSDDELYVGLVKFTGTTKNSWMQDTVLLESGTDPVFAGPDTRHLTFRYNDVYRCYNKGGNGNCYYDIRGRSILVTKERVRKIRHVAVQKEAKYNVLYKNNFEVDVNFHNGDFGSNLVEGNSIKLPFVHKWENLATGGAGQHIAPGPDNLAYKNNTDHIRANYNSIPQSGVVYEVVGYSDVDPLSNTPNSGTLYPMKFN